MEKPTHRAKGLLCACGCLACWIVIGAIFAAIQPLDSWPWALLRSTVQAATALCFSIAVCGLSPATCGLCLPVRGALPPFLCCIAIAVGFALFAPSAIYYNANSEPIYGLSAFLQLVFSAPLAEELVFRGAAQGCAYSFGSSGILLQAIVFALLHTAGIPQLYALATGLALGWLRQRTNSIWWCVILHTLNNFIVYMVFLK